MSGRVLDQQGQPAAGASVTIANESPVSGSFEATTDGDGRFRLEDVLLTDVVTLGISWNPFHKPVPAHRQLRETLASGEFELILRPATVDLRGSVVATIKGRDVPVPGATLRVLVGDDEFFVGSSDQNGNFALDGVALTTFSAANRGRVRIALPDAWTLAGRFEPGESLIRDLDLAGGLRDGSIDLGTVGFRSLSNPDATVELGGRVVGADRADPDRLIPIDGLVIRALSTEGLVVGEAVTTAGTWSMTLPKGEYTFDLPNAAELGFFQPLPTSWRVEFSNTQLNSVLKATGR